MKRLVARVLAWCAKRYASRCDIRIVGVTGSYGKTSTRLAIYAVLKEAKWSVATPKENYNNEFGFPLGVLGLESPGSSAVGWLQTMGRALWLATFCSLGHAPSTLVLEYGADRKGDIARLCRIVRPHIAVLTGVSPVHAEKIGTIEEIVAEKATLGQMVQQGGVVVVNGDDVHADELVKKVHVPVCRYGFTESAQVRVTEFSVEAAQKPRLTLARLHVQSKISGYDLEMHDVLGKPVAVAAAAAIAVAEILKLHPEVAFAALLKFVPPQGRLRPLPGIKGTIVIDDTYNAAPAAVIAAVEALRIFPLAGDGRRIAVLGHMAELGQYTESEHKKVGAFVAGSSVDLLLCVGERARDIARGAVEAGMKREAVMEFATHAEAGVWLDRNIHAGDVVLVKGAQSARMEKIVKEIMAEPLRATELLVRQYGKWLE